MSTIEERLATLEAQVASLKSQAAAGKTVDLANDKYADFTIRRCPPKWLDSGGRDYAGDTISTTTPEFCEAMAAYLDWQAEKDEAKNHSYVNREGKTVFPAPFARKDAARARAWAVKLRSSAPSGKPWTPPAQRRAPAQSDFGMQGNTDDEIPF